jgi:hypothetical protein
VAASPSGRHSVRQQAITSSGSYAAAPSSGGFASSGPYSATQNPVSRDLRLLKTQLTLAVGQREEDPERAWLEAVSVREKLVNLEQGMHRDPLLVADVDRFRAKLDEQVTQLTREMGDDLLAPLYSWMDLLTQRSKLEREVDTARGRVAEVRGARGVAPEPIPSNEDAAAGALQAVEEQLRWWKSHTPPAPPPNALVLWTQSGGDALRPSMPSDPAVAGADAREVRAVVTAAGTRALGAVSYAGSKLEMALDPALGALAVLLVVYAHALHGESRARNAMAIVAVLLFFGALAASALSRRRSAAERRAGLAWVWHHTLFAEQASALELEAGWLRALVAALRARRAFDAHKGEGGQLRELARWRPDLEPFVAEAAKSRVPRSA